MTQVVRIGPVFAGSEATFSEIIVALCLVVVPVMGWAAGPAFSVAVFVATGKMAADGELTALGSGGVSPAKIYVGPVIFALVLFLGLAFVWLDLSPRSQASLRDRAVSLASRAIVGKIAVHRFSSPVSNVTFLAEEKTEEGVWRGVFIEDARSADRTVHLVARTARMESDKGGQGLRAILGKGTGFVTSTDLTATAIAFESMEIHIPLSHELSRSLDFLPPWRAIPTQKLLEIPGDHRDASRLRYALWTRVVAPLGFLVIAVLSIVLAVRLAIRQRALAVAAAAAIFLAYHLLNRFFEGLLESGAVSPAGAALTPIFVVGVAGATVTLLKRRVGSPARRA